MAISNLVNRLQLITLYGRVKKMTLFLWVHSENEKKKKKLVATIFFCFLIMQTNLRKIKYGYNVQPVKVTKYHFARKKLKNPKPESQTEKNRKSYSSDFYHETN